MFGSCTPDQLDRLAEFGDPRAVNDSDDVVREGDKGGTFFVITGGHACVTRGEREVGVLGPGDYFGELSLFDPAPRDATITAVGPLSLVSLPRAAFTQALNEIPDVSRFAVAWHGAATARPGPASLIGRGAAPCDRCVRSARFSASFTGDPHANHALAQRFLW